MQAMPAAHRETGTPQRLSWTARWLGMRDRLLASSTFRRKAAAFPLTAPIARARARELFDLVAGFVYSQVLLACVQLRLFDILAEGPQSVARLADRLALPMESAERLIAAAVALRLVERRGDHVGEQCFGLGPLGASMVGNTAIAAMVEHHAALYADLRDPVALLRNGGAGSSLARYWPYADASAPDALSKESIGDYSALMSASQPLVADEILDAYPMSRHRCLLDVGGGEGGFVMSAARRAPALQLMLFDLPAVADRARTRCAPSDAAARLRIFGGSFLTDPLPQGADIVTLVRVMHDHDDATCLRLLRAVRCALPQDGTLLVAEPLAQTPGAERMGDAYFGFYLLAMGRGRPRTVEQLRALLERAGFDRVRQIATRVPLQTGLLWARAAAPASPNATN